jgi:hypothetical protein
MELTYQCPVCGAVNHVASPESKERAVCALCGASHRLHPAAVQTGRLLACPWCATPDLYVQKDFPQGLGLFIVVVGFAISTIFWYFEKPIFTYLVLLASALLDLVLYYKVPDVTICYRCLSQIRGSGSNPRGAFQPFDLAIGERYRQERLRIQELRRRATPGGAPPAEAEPDVPVNQA